MGILTLCAPKNNIETLGKLSLTNPGTGLPYVGSAVWLSLHELSYSESFLRKNLYAIGKFYRHVAKKMDDPNGLDRLLIDSANIQGLTTHVRTFVGELQNLSAISKVDHSRTLRRVVRFIDVVATEFAYRKSHSSGDISVIKREASKLQVLYKFLKPPQFQKKVPIRSVPRDVLEEIFDRASPDCPENTARLQKLARRNYLIINLFFLVGLRKGELLNLETDSFHSEYCPDEQRQIYWLNVKESTRPDPRVRSPKLKNKNSQRQLPISNELYNMCLSYIGNWRGRCSHSFLIISVNGSPLAERSLNEIFVPINQCLSSHSKDLLFQKTGRNRISPHSLRHSSAVYRMKSYKNMGLEISHAEALMRAFYGWSKNSKMPAHYARAFYEEQLITVWGGQFDALVSQFSSQ